MTLSSDRAETVALQAAAWLAAHEELLPVFLGSTGAGEDTFRAGLQDPVFQASILDFILMDDAWIRSFCDANILGYDMPSRARAELPGGGEVHWT